MLELQHFFIREQVAFLKTTDVYDILNADTQQPVGVAKEEPGALVAALRWVLSKKLMPTTVVVRELPGDNVVFTIKKPVALFRHRVDVLDADGKRLGYFKSKLFSLGGGFYVYDDKDQLFAEIKGKWHGFEFKFVDAQGGELGAVTKKWGGLAKELFTTADNYVVTISDDLADQKVAKILLLAAALAIDIVYYEQQG
jgi:uncharacterized protein YxjI